MGLLDRSDEALDLLEHPAGGNLDRLEEVLWLLLDGDGDEGFLGDLRRGFVVRLAEGAAGGRLLGLGSGRGGRASRGEPGGDVLGPLDFLLVAVLLEEGFAGGVDILADRVGPGLLGGPLLLFALLGRRAAGAEPHAAAAAASEMFLIAHSVIKGRMRRRWFGAGSGGARPGVVGMKAGIGWKVGSCGVTVSGAAVDGDVLEDARGDEGGEH